MSLAERSEELQNADGGWGYGLASSWTEPTAYAVMALAAEGSDAAARRGGDWLASRQRSDGGWPPQPAVEQSTWVTALAMLVPERCAERIDRGRARRWLLEQTGKESGFVYRLRMKLLGVKLDDSVDVDGWPWFPGAAAWVEPTALSVLALAKEHRRSPAKELGDRIAEGRQFLLRRRCRDGGWNHGSTRALGYESESYPETTGVALLALHGTDSGTMSAALAAGERHLSLVRSAAAASWLVMGLASHGRKLTAKIEPRNKLNELALASLARSAIGFQAEQ